VDEGRVDVVDARPELLEFLIDFWMFWVAHARVAPACVKSVGIAKARRSRPAAGA
jgi:hypothetical protein